MDQTRKSPYAGLSKELRAQMLELLEKEIAEDTQKRIEGARRRGLKAPRRRVLTEMAELLSVTHVSILQMLNRRISCSDTLFEKIVEEAYKRNPAETTRLIDEALTNQREQVMNELDKLSKKSERRRLV